MVIQTRLPGGVAWDCQQTCACLNGTWPIATAWNAGTGFCDITIAAAVLGLRSHTRIIATSNAVNPSYDQIRCDVLVTGVGDAAAINAEIVAMAAAGGGILYLAEGTYNLEASLQLATNVYLEGAGSNTVLTTTAVGYHVITAPGVNHTGVRKLTIQAAQGAGWAGIGWIGTDDSYVDEMWFDCGDIAVFLDTCNRVTVHKCMAGAAAVYGYYAVDCTDILIHQNVTLAASGANAYGIYIETCTRFGVSHNVVQDATIGGLFVSGGANGVLVGNQLYNIPFGAFWGSIRVDACEETEIVANEVIDCGGNGIDIVNHHSVVCSSNVVIRSELRGIILNTGSRSTVADNIIDDPGNDGIYLLNSNSCKVQDNHVYEAGQDGVNLESSDHNTVDGNTVRANGVTLNGINVFNAACNLNLILNNDLYTAGTVNNYLDAGTNTQERANRVDADPATGSGWVSAKPRTATRVVAASNASDDWWGHGYADYYCDGAADEVEINAAIAYVNAAGGGTVFLSEGTFTLAASIALLTGVILVGAGYNTVLNGAGFSLVLANTQDSVGVRLLRTTGNVGAWFAGIEYNSVADSFIDTVWLENTGDYGVWVHNGSAGVNVRNSYADGPNNGFAGGSLAGGCLDSQFMGNTVIATASLYGMYFGFGSSRCAIAGNIVIGGLWGGIVIDGGDHNSIVRNIVRDTAAGFVGAIGLGVFNPSTQCEVANNICVDCDGATAVIFAANGNNNLIADNSILGALAMAIATAADDGGIVGNIIVDSEDHGILVNGGSHNVIGHNSIHGANQAVGNFDGIHITGDSDHNLVTNNVVRADGVTRYGIRINAATCNMNQVHGNDLYTGGVTADYSDAGTGTLERDNRVTEGWYSLRVKPLHQTGTWYGGDWEASYTSTTQPVAADTLYALPIRIPLVHQYQNIGVDVTLGDGAGGVARLGIYSDLNGWPNALLEDCGVISTNAIAVQTRPVTITLPAGIVWLVYLGDHGNPPRIRCHYNLYSVTTNIIGHTAVNSTVSNGGVIAAQAYGALPAAFPGGGAIGNINNYYFPRILLQY